MPSVVTCKCLLNQSINEEVFFTTWIGFHLGRAQGLVKCELSVHERKILLIQAWCSLVTLGLENMVIENVPIFLLTSLTFKFSTQITNYFPAWGKYHLSASPWVSAWRQSGWCVFLVWALPCSGPHHSKALNTVCKLSLDYWEDNRLE